MKLNKVASSVSFSRGSLLAVAVAAGAVITLATGESRAEQFILFDATFTYTWQDAISSTPSKSHYYVTESNWLNKDRPTNWVSPVNYRDGTVHIRIDVLEKPAGTQQVGWALCYIANSGGYGCPYTPYYTETGLYERDVSMRDFWNNETIQWDRGIKQVDLIYTIHDRGDGHIHNYESLKDQTTPTKVRITMVQVSEGATYDPSIFGGNTGTGGTGGSSGRGGAAGEVGTGGTTNGTGGSSVSGGSPGTGGVPPTGSGGSSAIGSGDAGGENPPTTANTADGGCACAVPGHEPTRNSGRAWFALGLLASVLRLRRQRSQLL